MEKQRRTRQYVGVFSPVAFGVLLAGFFFFSRSTAYAAWTEPTQPPPGGNVAAPLNTSGTAQIKSGNLTLDGGVFEVTHPSAWNAVTGSAADATSTGTAGIVGYGAVAAANKTSAGVYGIAYQGPGTGTHVGLMGVAGNNAGNSIGVFGSANGYTNAYAGYFEGRVGVSGELCLNGDCQASWPSGGTGSSLFTESPPNSTYLTNEGSNLAIGGKDASDAKFFFNITGQTPGVFYAADSIIVGTPIGGGSVGDGICSAGEQCSSSPDCKGQPDDCGAGKICDPNGTGTCITTDTTAPTVPGNLQLDGMPGSATVPLRWVASTDNPGGTGLHGYKLYRCQGVGCTPATVVQTPGASATTVTDTGLSSNTTYVFDLTAVDNASPANESGHSNRLTVTTAAGGDTEPPSTPANLRQNGSPAYTSIPLAWDASTDNIGVAGYTLYRCPGSGCTPTLFQTFTGATILSYTDSSVLPNRLYIYRVSAFDGAGNPSALSTALQVTTPNDTGRPSQVQNLTQNGDLTNSSIPLRWDAATDAESGIDFYKLYRCTGRNCSPTTYYTSVTGTTYTDTGLPAA
ncbi:MAG: fibronectin type III domain-containing protein, partial [bacterium]